MSPVFGKVSHRLHATSDCSGHGRTRPKFTRGRPPRRAPRCKRVRRGDREDGKSSLPCVSLPDSFLYKEEVTVINFPQATGIFPDSLLPEITLSSHTAKEIWLRAEGKKKGDMF